MGPGSFLARGPNQEGSPAKRHGGTLPRGDCSLPLVLLEVAAGTERDRWVPAQLPSRSWKPPAADAGRRSAGLSGASRSQGAAAAVRQTAARPGCSVTRSDGITITPRSQACRPVAAATLRARPARSVQRGNRPPQSLAAPRRSRALLMGPHAPRCPHSLIRRAFGRAIGRSKSVRIRARGAVPVATRSRPPGRPRLRTRGF